MDLLLSLFFGAIGTGYLVYAKRQHSVMFLITGVILVLYPYFISNTVAIVLIGVVVSAIPIAAHRGWF